MTLPIGLASYQSATMPSLYDFQVAGAGFVW
jgi:hypothetical protein